MYNTTYKKSGGTFFCFSKIWPILSMDIVKNKEFWLLSQNINHLFLSNKLFYDKNQNSLFLTMIILKNGHTLPKWKNVPPDFLYVVSKLGILKVKFTFGCSYWKNGKEWSDQNFFQPLQFPRLLYTNLHTHQNNLPP